MPELSPFSWLLTAFVLCYGAYRLWMRYAHRCGACNGRMTPGTTVAARLRNLGSHFKVPTYTAAHGYAETYACRKCGDTQTFSVSVNADPTAADSALVYSDYRRNE